MLPDFDVLRDLLTRTIRSLDEQGHDVRGRVERLAATPDSYDTLMAFARELAAAPLRADWPWVEPHDIDGIKAETGPEALAPLPVTGDVAARVRAAFLASCCGCMLGKPIEVNPNGPELKAAAAAAGLDFPFTGYLPERFLTALGRRHGDWTYTVAERIDHVGPDDDLNYAVIGMLNLERHGRDFTHDQLSRLWLNSIPLHWQWGPERLVNLRAGLHHLVHRSGAVDPTPWSAIANPGVEECGALIRADAYGYACPGDPWSATRLAWRDASYTHRRSGVYGTMFAAAAIAVALAGADWRTVVERGAAVVPRRSRLRRTLNVAMGIVADAPDWWTAHERIREQVTDGAGHCRVHRELACLVNTIRFARDAGHGIGLQVSQGDDTDSYGCTAGAITGAMHGDASLALWLQPLNDRIVTTVAGFAEQRLSAVADRMAALHRLPV